MITSSDYCSSIIVGDRSTSMADAECTVHALAGNGLLNPYVSMQTAGIEVAELTGPIGVVVRESLFTSSGISVNDARRLLDLSPNYARAPDSDSSCRTLSPLELQADSDDGLCHSMKYLHRRRTKSSRDALMTWHPPQAERQHLRRSPKAASETQAAIPAIPARRSLNRTMTFDLTGSRLLRRRQQSSSSTTKPE
eukprot:NODE_14942_length_1076_cov_11.328767.p1 GENE.NODE_14942_length_1076_cov_11.328767~~NODE_14942_length_1076_cov_11.328767.p1  ORF type:complete len:195 (+),score=10.79 NODE_14942_length_1076_cov_11.328767:213-797(+)